MAHEFRLPDIGEGVVEGEVVRWLVKVGESVREDQPMVEVMTDKATVEIPSPWAGTVAAIEAPEGKLCKVGQVMVRIEAAAGAAIKAAEPAHEKSAAATGNGAPRPTLAAVPPPARAQQASTSESPAYASIASGASGSSLREVNGSANGGAKPMATPATRKLARDLGVDLSLVSPTGDNGRVTSDDVRSFSGGAAPRSSAAASSRGSLAGRGAAALAEAEASRPAGSSSPSLFGAARSAATPAPSAPHGPVAVDATDERVPFRGVRKKIAENMIRSKHSAAHFTYVEDVDLTELVALRTRAKKRAEERGIRLSFIPFIVKAVVAGLKKFPILNSSLDEERGEIVLHKRYHIGVAAASQQGLIVPVVKDADRKSLFEIAAELEALSEKAKNGKASREELTGSTFTISSLGTLGGVLATPIINYPEVAILGVHKIKQTPVVHEGQIAIRDMANFSISLDHRIVDGYEGAQFLQHVLTLLSDPTLMFLESV